MGWRHQILGLNILLPLNFCCNFRQANKPFRSSLNSLTCCTPCVPPLPPLHQTVGSCLCSHLCLTASEGLVQGAQQPFLK